MNSLAVHQHTDRSKKRAKSASPNLKAMHDQANNSYHSSLYRWQAQTQQQNDRSAKTPSTLNKNASCDSPAQSLKGSFSPTLPASAAAPAQSLTLSSPSHPAAAIHINAKENNYVNSPVDFKSLYDAMEPISSTPPINFTDSSCGTQDSMLSYLCKHDELTQNVDTVGQLETISFLRIMYMGTASLDERHHFLKKLSDGLSETLCRHTPSTVSSHSAHSATTAHSISITAPQQLSPRSYRFRECKHRLIPLDMLLANNRVDHDNSDGHGISIVEADFTTASNNYNTVDPYTRHQRNQRHDPELICHYIYTQLQQHCPTSALQAVLNPPSHWDTQPFNGRVYCDDKSNGIDLCVYFYNDAQQPADVSEDMEILWKISTLGVSVLPILSTLQQSPSSPSSPPQTPSSPRSSISLVESVSTKSSLVSKMTNITTTTPLPPLQNDLVDILYPDTEEDEYDDSNTSSLHLNQRNIDIRRNELAHLFSVWRIKMLDISNLENLEQPSFQLKDKSRSISTHQDMMIEKLLGQTWLSSSLVSPTPSHVLTLPQFMAIDKWAVSRIITVIGRKKCPPNKQGNHSTPFAKPSSSSPTSIIESIIESEPPKEAPPSSSSSPLPSSSLSPAFDSATLYTGAILCVVLICGLFCALTFLPGASFLSLVAQPTWHASLIMVSHHHCGKSMFFIANVYDSQDQPRWAPEPPLLATNMPLSASAMRLIPPCIGCCTIATSTYSSISADDDSSLMVVQPLPNSTQQHSLDGQYFYLMPKPSCSTLDVSVDYYVQVKSSVIFSSKKAGMVQVSPIYTPMAILCDDPSSTGSMSNQNNVMEAWLHFKQHLRFYLLNSIKIIDLMFTEGDVKD